jgi:hypothetical protein
VQRISSRPGSRLLPFDSFVGGGAQFDASPLQHGIMTVVLHRAQGSCSLKMVLHDIEAGMYHDNFLHAKQERFIFVVARGQRSTASGGHSAPPRPAQ